LCLFLTTVLDQIADAPVIGPLPVPGKETTGDRALGAVIPDAFAAQALLGAIISAGTFLEVLFLQAFHDHSPRKEQPPSSFSSNGMLKKAAAF
jgi:hypothetical protein